MSRGFQFSLRALLVAATLVCLALGGVHLLETYGSRIEVADVVVGKPISVKGRYVHFFGPSTCWIHAALSKTDDASFDRSFDTFDERVEGFVGRSWLCLYDFEWTADRKMNPGEWAIAVSEVVPRPQGGIVDSFRIFKMKTFNVTPK